MAIRVRKFEHKLVGGYCTQYFVRSRDIIVWFTIESLRGLLAQLSYLF